MNFCRELASRSAKPTRSCLNPLSFSWDAADTGGFRLRQNISAGGTGPDADPGGGDNNNGATEALGRNVLLPLRISF